MQIDTHSPGNLHVEPLGRDVELHPPYSMTRQNFMVIRIAVSAVPQSTESTRRRLAGFEIARDTHFLQHPGNKATRYRRDSWKVPAYGAKPSPVVQYDFRAFHPIEQLQERNQPVDSSIGERGGHQDAREPQPFRLLKRGGKLSGPWQEPLAEFIAVIDAVERPASPELIEECEGIRQPLKAGRLR